MDLNHHITRGPAGMGTTALHSQRSPDDTPTPVDDLGAIPLEGSGFEDQQPDENESEE